MDYAEDYYELYAERISQLIEDNYQPQSTAITQVNEEMHEILGKKGLVFKERSNIIRKLRKMAYEDGVLIKLVDV
jgi:uncharacterized tellurite resistance protein B-like protein